MNTKIRRSESSAHNAKHQNSVRVLPLLLLGIYTQASLASETLEEVIVTAQKRAERLQDVPISISAIGGSQLETRGIEGGADLSGLAPNLVVAKSPNADLISQISIRGSVTSQPSILVDPSVGMYIDGIYVAKSQGNLSEMVDLERIEVLRGPQGTLFGRNTLAGAINFISRKPLGSLSGAANLEVGNYGRAVQRLSVDLPKAGITSLSFALRNEKQDGWLKNDTGRANGDRDRQSFRLSANFDISPDFQLDYKYDHTAADEAATPATMSSSTGYVTSRGGASLTSIGNMYLGYGMASVGNMFLNAAAAANPDRPDSFSSDANQRLGQKLKVNGHTLIATYQLNANNTFKYLGSHRKMFYWDALDLDGTRQPIGISMRDTNLKTMSHEFQWIGDTERTNYVAGYYFFKEDGLTFGPRSTQFGTPTATASVVNSGVTTNQKALYGQLDYKATNQLTLAAGVRRTNEERGLEASQYLTASYLGPITRTTVAPVSYSTSFSSTTPSVSAIYKFTDNFNVYARLAKGFKSGGWNGESTVPAVLASPYLPEESNTFELGFKSNFGDGRGMLNATYFHNKITDMQLTMLPPGSLSTNIANAGKATTQGIEIETVWQIQDGWRVHGSYGYLDAKFDQYMDTGANPPNAGLLIDTASNRVMPFAPKHTLNLTMDGRLAKTAYGALRLIADYSYLSERAPVAVNKSLTAPNAINGGVMGEYSMPAMTTINARLLLANVPVGGPGQADMSIWAKNLTDEKKMTNVIDFGIYRLASWMTPRTYGLSFGYKW